MPFQTANDYYSFELSVKHNYRHSLEPAARNFLDTLIETSKKRARKLSKASIYWRAQRGCDLTSVKHSDNIMLAFPYDSDRMKPRQRQATEGRVNVRGIPCLYLAT